MCGGSGWLVEQLQLLRHHHDGRHGISNPSEGLRRVCVGLRSCDRVLSTHRCIQDRSRECCCPTQLCEGLRAGGANCNSRGNATGRDAPTCAARTAVATTITGLRRIGPPPRKPSRSWDAPATDRRQGCPPRAACIWDVSCVVPDARGSLTAGAGTQPVIHQHVCLCPAAASDKLRPAHRPSGDLLPHPVNGRNHELLPDLPGVCAGPQAVASLRCEGQQRHAWLKPCVGDVGACNIFSYALTGRASACAR